MYKFTYIKYIYINCTYIFLYKRITLTVYLFLTLNRIPIIKRGSINKEKETSTYSTEDKINLTYLIRSATVEFKVRKEIENAE